MTMQRLFLTALVLLATTSGSVYASLVPIEEFPGDAAEGFENLAPIGGYPAPIMILDNQGAFDDSLAHFVMLASSLWSASTNQYLFPYNGNIMGGSVTGWAAFGFVTPVSDFGCYLGTSDIPNGSTIAFRDEIGDLIDTFPIAIPSGDWAWFGWHSDVPIKSIEVMCSVNPGIPLCVDDMHVNFVPEPASLGLIVLGAATLIRRRH